MTRKPFEFQICGLTLHGQFYEPQEVKAVVVLVHGMGEYSRRYEQTVVPKLLKQSFAVISYDQFGHGLSEGKKGDHPGYECILDGLEQMLNKASSLFQPLPTFLYGHSMGGNVVINYVLRRENKLSGVIATSPFLKLAFKPPAWKMAFGKILDLIYPSLTMPNELDPQALSKDQKEVEAYLDDPMIHDKVSTRFSLAFMQTGEWAIDNASSLKTPMLLLHGTKDRITSHLASKEFAEKANGQVKFVPIENGYHELHHDIEKNIVLNQICDWIQKQIPKP